jgi:hypothetical protein
MGDCITGGAAYMPPTTTADSPPFQSTYAIVVVGEECPRRDVWDFLTYIRKS